MFVTFEGPEGSGKSTQIRLAAEALRRQGVEPVVTREPGGTPIGDQIRKVLLDGANARMVSECELLLYWAARAQHVRELIRPNLEKGRLILCDRYTDSTVAYQGYARGIDFQVLDELDRIATGRLTPDKTFLLDLPPEEGLQRALGRMAHKVAAEREDRFENEALAFHRRVRDGFLELASKVPSRFVVLDATLPVEILHGEIMATLDALKRTPGATG